ncbi:MAG TPA: tryptophan--tRNA ligase [Candidatus Rubrimentiphilum sp.]|nr:tryptophan--tRNA ligase [Candidatus Rubrimentiphilum sp.]
MTTATTKRPRVMSGMRPTGNLHLGHYVGVLTQWVKYCDTADAFFEIADLHALTTGFEDPQAIRDARNEMVVDWLAAGVDPKKSTLYLQSGIPEISELETLLGMITPISWLERVPTYKGQIAEIGPEIATYGFLGYPLLQLCDIAIFHGELVPVGKDQVAHLEFAREVVRRFNYLYGGGEEILVEPKAMLSNFPDVPGTDGRKMSKSYNNVILLSDDDAATTEKVRGMLTDPQKIRRNDPGRPEICPVFSLWKFVKPQHTAIVERDCRSGALGCVQDKGDLAEALNEFLKPLRERRKLFAADKAYVEGIIAEGTARARGLAAKTLADVKRAMKLT